MSGADDEENWGEELDEGKLWKNSLINSSALATKDEFNRVQHQYELPVKLEWYGKDETMYKNDVRELKSAGLRLMPSEWEKMRKRLYEEYLDYLARQGALTYPEWLKKLAARHNEIIESGKTDQAYIAWVGTLEDKADALPYEIWKRRNAAKKIRESAQKNAYDEITHAPLRFYTFKTRKPYDITIPSRDVQISVMAQKIEATQDLTNYRGDGILGTKPIPWDYDAILSDGERRIRVMYDAEKKCYFLPVGIAKITGISPEPNSNAPANFIVRFGASRWGLDGQIITEISDNYNSFNTPWATMYRKSDGKIYSGSPQEEIYRYLRSVVRTTAPRQHQLGDGETLRILITEDTAEKKVVRIGIYQGVAPVSTVTFEKDRLTGIVKIVAVNNNDNFNIRDPDYRTILDIKLDKIDGRESGTSRAWREMSAEYTALEKKQEQTLFMENQRYKKDGDVSITTTHASGKFRLRRERRERDHREWDL